MTFLTPIIRLARLGMSPFTISVPILGAFSAGNPTFAQILMLGAIGLCAHIFGFALNDLIDHPLDRTLPTHAQHPLVSGAISRRAAWIITLLPVPISLALLAILHPPALPLLLTSIGLSVIYNLSSKWGKFPRLAAELSLALSIGLLALVSTLVVGRPYMASAAPDGIYAIPTTGIIFSLAITLCLLLLNSVASGLKDLKTDAAFGARSFVLSAGAKMLDADRLTISPALKRYSFALQALFLATLLLLAIQSPPAFGTGLLALLLALYGALHLRMLLNVTSFRALRRSLPLLNGYYNYGALVLLVPLPAPLMLLAILCALALLTIPLQLAWRVWRERYAQIKPPSRQERQENTREN